MDGLDARSSVPSLRSSCSTASLSDALSAARPSIHAFTAIPDISDEEAPPSPRAEDKLIFPAVLEPAPAPGPGPPFRLVAAYHVRGLWPPLLILVASLLGAYFIPSLAGNLALLAVSHLAVITYFFLASAAADRGLVASIAEEVKAMLAAGPDSAAPLSSDGRVRFVLREVQGWQDAAGGLQPTDPLFFLASSIAAWRDAVEGYVVLNSVGVILYCNGALLRHFQYTREDLLSEDIATLIPAPYNHLHRAFMRKYNRDAPKQTVVGCSRLLPVIDKAGEQSIIELHVEEAVDPRDPFSVVFVGRMTFPEGPSLPAELRQRLESGAAVPVACQALQRKESYAVVDGTGIILYTSTALTSMVGWRAEEMAGKNVAMLMNPKLSRSHDQHLGRYVAQVLDAGGAFPPNAVVCRGRDQAVLCAHGEYVRAWVSVEGLRAPTKEPRDCLFVAVILLMQSSSQQQHRRDSGAEGLLSSSAKIVSARGTPGKPTRGGLVSNPSRATHRTARSQGPAEPGLLEAPAPSARSTVSPHSGLRATGLARRKCTLMLFDVYGIQAAGGEQLSVEYQTFLSMLVSTCTKNGLQIHDPIGDRILVTSNLRSSGGSQRSVVGMVMQQVLQSFHSMRSFGVVQVYAAACSTEMHIGYFGKQTVLAGEGFDLCVCMLQLAAEVRARRGFIDPSLHSELQFTYDCRVANVVTLYPRQKRSCTLPIYELIALKEMGEDEWLYQIEGEQRADPLAAWAECWAHLLQAPSGALPGQYLGLDALPRNTAAALECLSRHLEDHEDDPLALWLHRALRQADGTPAAVHTAGKLPYLPLLHLPDPGLTALHARRASRRRTPSHCV
eukprot:EG_transcript_1671